MIARKTARSGVVLWLLALICCAQWAHALDLEEYRVKASLLGNFAMFTEWPDAVGETLTLCVYGPDPFGEDLSSLKGKKIAKRSLAVKRSTASMPWATARSFSSAVPSSATCRGCLTWSTAGRR